MSASTLAALIAAESILRCMPDINTNVGGTRPSTTTSAALALVRAEISKADALADRATP